MRRRRLLLVILACLVVISPAAALENIVSDDIADAIVLEDATEEPDEVPVSPIIIEEEESAETPIEDIPAEDIDEDNIATEDKEVEGDFEIENGILLRYLGAGGNIVIPEGVTEIASGVFNGKQTITGVTFPSTLTKIGDEAFWACNNLAGDLIIPDAVTSIGDSAFSNCFNLDGTLQLGDGLKTIGVAAFESCEKLTGDLIIPDSVTRMGDGAFAWCMGFDGRIQWPQNMTAIPNNAFFACFGFTADLIIPDHVTSIGDTAFAAYGGSTEDSLSVDFNGRLQLSKNLKTIGLGAFISTNFTGDLIIPDSVTSIGDGAFMGCSGFDGRLQLPQNLETITDNAFNWCLGFTGDLIIPNSVTSIGEGAFYAYGGSTEKGSVDFDGRLQLSKNLETIAPTAFMYCGFTGDLIIPDTVTDIGMKMSKRVTVSFVRRRDREAFRNTRRVLPPEARRR